MRETSTVMDDGWRRVWAEMTDAELEDNLFTYLWLSIHSPNAHLGGVAHLNICRINNDNSDLLHLASAS